MNNLEFLQLVLPAGGSHYFAAELKKGGAMPHYHTTSVEALNQKIETRSDKTENNLYFALASFKTESYVNEKGATKSRTQENVDKVKCFWIDLDCKGKASDYASQREAAEGIKKFSEASGIGRPTAVVNSGYGLHAYWVMDIEMTGEQWSAIAHRWRNTLDLHGVKHDSSCTTDSARILRPIGTVNYKPGNDPLAVHYVGGSGTVYNTLEFVSKLSRDSVTRATTLPSFAAVQGLDMSLNEAVGEAEYPPSSAITIAKECGLVLDMLRLGGNVSEPLWHKVIGLMKHTTESAEAIHAVSNKHPSYTRVETENKAAAWQVGPPSCVVLENESKELPPHCANCKHRGKLTSPIQLGYARAAVAERTVIVEAGIEVEKTVEIPPLPLSMDNRFRWLNGRLERNVPDDKGKLTWKPFCNFHVFPSSYYDDEEDNHVMVWTVREREGVFKEFELTGGAIGTGGAPLYKELGQKGVVSIHGGNLHMSAYLTEWFNEIKRNKVGVETYTHFGWHEDDFLLGTTLLKKDGSKVDVRLGGDAAKIQEHFVPKGSLEKWKHLIDKAYNHDDQEQYQFLLGVGFGSPLIKLFNVSGGVVFSAISYDSGQGKTTAAQASAGIFACPKGGREGITLTKQQATMKAVFAMAGVLNGVPLIVDELTNTKAEEASDTVYTFSQGSARIGLHQDGHLNYNRHGWAGLMSQTSNKPLTSIITGAKPGADAELARLVEFTFENVSKLHKSEADELFPELFNCHGHAGLEYMAYVVSHQEEVVALLRSVQKILDAKLNLARKDRFWSMGIASVIAGLMIAKKVGLVQFNVAKITEWVGNRIRDMRKEIDATSSTPSECFTMMITELSQGFIVTDIEGDKRAGAAVPAIVREPRGPLTGRVIASTAVGYVVASAMHAWCTKHQVNLNAVIKAAVDNGWIMEPIAVLRYPAKGTPFTMGQSRCYMIDWRKLENALTVAPHMAKVLNLMDGTK